ncbi:MAG: pyridoxamine 5'-phosphate oxidase family protein [Candidatus Cloacimonetes bacterium]|nr:pyridoxamine 5'-phosphate oxidase family protein [Candidatus Cloacimonadota bacterium]
MKRSEVLDRFEVMQEAMLATTDGERAYVRPVMLIYYQERFFIATGNADAKCSQIRKQGRAEVCYYPDTEEKGCYIRFNGDAKLISDIDLKGEIMEVATFIKSYWTDPADSGYAVIEIIPDWFDFMAYGTSVESRVKG